LGYRNDNDVTPRDGTDNRNYCSVIEWHVDDGCGTNRTAEAFIGPARTTEHRAKRKSDVRRFCTRIMDCRPL